MFEDLKDRIRMQAHEMRNRDYLRDLITDAAQTIEQYAPHQTGTLVRNITTPSKIIESESGFHGGLGDRQLVGYENRGKPTGTIAAFLFDHPEFKRRGGGPDSTAWWRLSLEARDLLQQGREQGLYGGDNQGIAQGKSAYLFAQEGSFSGWSDSAAKAGITPTGFVRKALDEWRGQALPRMRAEMKARTGWN